MAVISIIDISKLKGAKRVDPEYYQPYYLALEKRLNKLSSRKLKNIAWITDGIHSSIDYDPRSPIRIISAQSVQYNDFDLSANTRISVEQHQKNLRTSLMVSDIIISSVGTIGNTAVVSEKMLPCNADRHVAIVRLRNKILDAFFISSFLNSKYGRFQTLRESTGNVQLNLFIEKIETLIIPDINNSAQIGNLTKEAALLLEKSRDLYSQSETLLLEELGLKDFKPEYKPSYTAKLSDAFGVHRLDAEYFQPVYETLMKKLKGRIELNPLRKFILSIQKGIEVGSEKYEEEGKLFIRVSNLSINGFTDRDQKYIGEELYQQLKTISEPKEGDFLLTKDATPGIAYVVKEPVEGIISSGILKLKINDNEINKEYLALCINSLVGKMQIERDSGGSVIIHLKPEQIKKLKIPILPPKTQQKISSLVQQSHESRKKAKELLEKAKRAVEIAVEEGEEPADRFLKTKRNHSDYETN